MQKEFQIVAASFSDGKGGWKKGRYYFLAPTDVAEGDLVEIPVGRTSPAHGLIKQVGVSEEDISPVHRDALKVVKLAKQQ